MVRAWYKDEDTEKVQHEPHMLDPEKLLDIKDLEKIGILYFQVSKLTSFIYEKNDNIIFIVYIV